MNPDELREKREVLARQLDEQRSASASAGRDERIGNLQRGIAKLDAEIEVADARVAEIRRLAGNPENRSEPPEAAHPKGRRKRMRNDTRSEERCTRVATDLYEADTGIGSAACDRLVAIGKRDKHGVEADFLEAVANPDFATAFAKRLRDPQGADLLTDDERRAVLEVQRADEARSMGLSEGKLGGFQVPAAIDPTIVLSSSGSVSPLRKLARNVTVVGSNVWKGVTAESVEASFDAEAAEVSDDAPELAQPEVPVEKAQAWLPFTSEYGEDAPDAQGEFARLLADAKDQLEAEKFILGAGSGSHEPEGLIAKLAESSEVETEASKEVKAGDVYATQEALGPRFQDNAQWLSTLTVASQIYRFSSPGGEEPPLFNPDRTKLLGKTWNECSPMSSKTTTKEESILLYGDLRNAYVVADRIGLRVELVPMLMGENGRPKGERGLYCHWRVGGAPTIDNAARVLVVKE